LTERPRAKRRFFRAEPRWIDLNGISSCGSIRITAARLSSPCGVATRAPHPHLLCRTLSISAGLHAGLPRQARASVMSLCGTHSVREGGTTPLDPSTLQMCDRPPSQTASTLQRLLFASEERHPWSRHQDRVHLVSANQPTFGLRHRRQRRTAPICAASAGQWRRTQPGEIASYARPGVASVVFRALQTRRNPLLCKGFRGGR
jgi:hypothetical protein